MSITLSQLAQRYGRAAGGIHGPLQQKLSTMAQVGSGPSRPIMRLIPVICSTAPELQHLASTRT